ncbi:hypothetical protein SUVZ_08G0570 [Saccharomyces uvarum]|uniref:Uncharacterized protein n=1 Tax=Saccharomyces uvarum TaxID=230603 RepID=A0ABN8WU71_SACUV|nr:hypothetical protein SUVZ_08G0570 [Saccharomyces uvarum]
MQYAMRIADHPVQTNICKQWQLPQLPDPLSGKYRHQAKKRKFRLRVGNASKRERGESLFPTKPYDLSTVTRPSAKRARKKRCACEICPFRLS